eukprot:GHVL01008603.1.p1 GENE.GHVL01008603.1~~GHVL01008603.1.p1  ORF type:complete len:1158 (+),score=241.70 GHVL01008603.1:140-3613(+)
MSFSQVDDESKSLLSSKDSSLYGVAVVPMEKDTGHALKVLSKIEENSLDACIPDHRDPLRKYLETFVDSPQFQLLATVLTILDIGAMITEYFMYWFYNCARGTCSLQIVNYKCLNQALVAGYLVIQAITTLVITFEVVARLYSYGCLRFFRGHRAGEIPHFNPIGALVNVCDFIVVVISLNAWVYLARRATYLKRESIDVCDIIVRFDADKLGKFRQKCSHLVDDVRTLQSICRKNVFAMKGIAGKPVLKCMCSHVGVHMSEVITGREFIFLRCARIISRSARILRFAVRLKRLFIALEALHLKKIDKGDPAQIIEPPPVDVLFDHGIKGNCKMSELEGTDEEIEMMKERDSPTRQKTLLDKQQRIEDDFDNVGDAPGGPEEGGSGGGASDDEEENPNLPPGQSKKDVVHVRTDPLDQGVSLITVVEKKGPQGFPRYKFTVRNTRGCPMKVTLDITGSVNPAVIGENWKGLVASVVAPPQGFQFLCAVEPVDIRLPFKLVRNLKWIPDEPSDSEMAPIVSKSEERIEKELAKIKRSRVPNTDEAEGDEILDACQAAGIQFIDTKFPPQISSIFVSPAEQAKIRGRVCWKRAPELFGEDVNLWNTIEPTDIEQGKLGNCWFLVALASGATWPESIERLFLTEKPNPQGVYEMRICRDGQWCHVTVDDYFPCTPGGGPIFSRSSECELWVLLLEKVCAKLFGSYEAIRGGVPYRAMMDLTGAPGTGYKLRSPNLVLPKRGETVWGNCKSWFEKGHLVAACTPGKDTRTEGKGGGDPLAPAGLVSGHAYSILRAEEVYTVKGRQRLLQLRNPWGHFEWLGPWSDASDEWTNGIRQQLDQPKQKKDDGVFWISEEDFNKYFHELQVCLLARTPFVSRHEIDFQRDQHGCHALQIISIETPGNMCLHICVQQPDIRPPDDSRPQQLTVPCIAIYELSEDRLRIMNEVKRLSHKGKQSRDNLLTCYLRAGAYAVVVWAPWGYFDLIKKVAGPHMSLNLYGWLLDRTVKRSDMKVGVHTKYDEEFWNQSLVTSLMEPSDPECTIKSNDLDTYKIWAGYLPHRGFGIAAHNKSSFQKLHLSTTVTNTDNLVAAANPGKRTSVQKSALNPNEIRLALEMFQLDAFIPTDSGSSKWSTRYTTTVVASKKAKKKHILGPGDYYRVTDM